MPIKIRKLAKTIRKIVKSDRDMVIAVSGFPGEGKSDFSCQLSRELDPKHFSFRRNIVFTKEDTKTKVEKLPLYSPVDVDEAIDVVWKGEFYTKDMRDIIKFFNKCRDKNKPVLLNIPDFWEFVKWFRGYRIRMWIFIVTRGTAIILKPDLNPFTDDRWHRKENEKLINRYTKKYGMVGGFIRGITKSKNYVDTLHWKGMPKSEYEEYKKVKNEAIYSRNGKDEKKSLDINEARIKWNKEIAGRMDKAGILKKKISEVFDVHVNTIGNWLKKKAIQTPNTQ